MNKALVVQTHKELTEDMLTWYSRGYVVFNGNRAVYEAYGMGDKAHEVYIKDVPSRLEDKMKDFVWEGIYGSPGVKFERELNPEHTTQGYEHTIFYNGSWRIRRVGSSRSGTIEQLTGMGHYDSFILYDHGGVAFDYPERLPEYIKAFVRNLADKAAPVIAVD